MYILIVSIPLMGALIAVLMGRMVGVEGAKRATVGLMGLT